MLIPVTKQVVTMLCLSTERFGTAGGGGERHAEPVGPGGGAGGEAQHAGRHRQTAGQVRQLSARTGHVSGGGAAVQEGGPLPGRCQAHVSGH